MTAGAVTIPGTASDPVGGRSVAAPVPAARLSRRTAAVTAALLATLALTACGTNGTGPGRTSAPAAGSPSAGASGSAASGDRLGEMRKKVDAADSAAAAAESDAAKDTQDTSTP
ncbi:hypothetical protein ACFWXO_34315 [Kitasatospora sp. NPDC059088]|uniref:hypothetical protein n=1 Tax=Kitasatospora sp. NPDC059088 TaxID=3346722 RepID=UPI003678B6E7